jgi:hypothetical protein
MSSPGVGCRWTKRPRLSANTVCASILALAMGLAPGCGTTAPSSTEPPGTLNRAALRVSHPRHIAAPALPSPAFKGITSGAALGGAFGLAGLIVMAANAEAEGRAVERKQVFDPAVAIRKDLVQRLAKRFGMETQDGKGAGPAKADLTLKVETAEWGFVPVRIGYYGITYDGTIALIDNRTNVTVATGSCTSRPVDTPDAPDYDHLLANDAFILKQKLGSLEDYCIDDYRKRILGLYGD